MTYTTEQAVQKAIETCRDDGRIAHTWIKLTHEELTTFANAIAQEAIAAKELEVKRLREQLERAHNGLLWYQDAYPEAVSEADHEEMMQIQEALVHPTTTEALEQYVAERVREAFKLGTLEALKEKE